MSHSMTCGADAFVALLNHNRTDYIFLNSGTDTFPVQEAITRLDQAGEPAPQLVTCPDELVAISAAHGYYLLSRQPQTVLVHVDAGTMQLGGGLHNAQRARAGMFLCAGTAPLTIEDDLPGHRNLWIHWIQDQADQAMAVRGYCKWTYELRRNESIHHVMNRAFQVASSEPAGPTYLTLPREVLMEPIQAMRLPRTLQPATLPDIGPETLAPIAEALAHARYPLIITGHTGRHVASVAPLAALAECIGAPVVTATASCLNISTTHPLWTGISPNVHLKEADVVLILDCDVPYIPADITPRPEARIFWLDSDPLKASMPLFTFPADLRLQVDTSKTLKPLITAIEDTLTTEDRARHSKRAATLEETHTNQRSCLGQSTKNEGTQFPITPAWLMYCIDQALDHDVIVLDETVTNARFVQSLLTRTQPGTWFTSGGASLGWALGASIGAKLASPEQTVVALVGDGTFMFGCPTAALWTAAAHHTPFLTIILNNEMHFATKRSWLMHYPEGTAKQANRFPGVDLSPSPDFAQLAQSCHAYGERVDDPQDLPEALSRGLEAVAGGQAAVLDVRIQRP
jgi:acetolactate synthase I/II/III large subunit